MDLEKYKERFKELQKKSQMVAIENRKMANKEVKELSMKGKPRVYSMKEEDQMTDSITAPSDERKNKLLNYKMREYEKWEQVQKRRKVKEHTGNADLQELAKHTYEKQLRRLKDESQNPKGEVNSGKIEKDDRSGKIRVQDNTVLVDQLANESKKLTTERYLSRKKEIERKNSRDAPGGYINDKNRQFNEKLDRQLKKTES